jgi:hypothetical protein
MTLVPEILGSGLIASMAAGIITGHLAAEDFGSVSNLTLLIGSGIMGGMIGGALGYFIAVLWMAVSVGILAIDSVATIVAAAIVAGLIAAFIGSSTGAVASAICGGLSGIHISAKSLPSFQMTPIRLLYGAAIGAAIGAYIPILVLAQLIILLSTADFR